PTVKSADAPTAVEAPKPPPPAKEPPERLTADQPRSTRGGATFTAPANWSIEVGSSMITLEAPEGDSRVALVDVLAPNADAAVSEAWKVYRPETKRPLRLSSPRPGRMGWDERYLYDYETSPNERLVVYALAARKGEAWTITIVDATLPTFDKRRAQIALVRT